MNTFYNVLHLKNNVNINTTCIKKVEIRFKKYVNVKKVVKTLRKS
jgi:hypothetical protein